MTNRRLRFRYAIETEASELGQRELVVAWQTACERSGLTLAAPEGRRASAQISLAAPLPRGITSSCELIDIVLAEDGPPASAMGRLESHPPTGMAVLSVEEVG